MEPTISALRLGTMTKLLKEKRKLATKGGGEGGNSKEGGGHA